MKRTPRHTVAHAAALALLALGALAVPARAQDASGRAISIRLVPEATAPGAPDAAGGRTVGDPFWVTVETRGPAGYSLLPESLLAAYGARPEVAILETARTDGALRLRIALFRVGAVVLPPVQALVLTAGGDTVVASVVADTLPIASVLAPGDTLLADIKPLWTERSTPWWVWLLAAALAAALAAWWWRRRRRRATPVGVWRADPDAYQDARARLEALRTEPADDAGRVAAAAGIGDALRDYLADGWGVPARERTTLELLPSLPPRLGPERAALGSALTVSDLAKFARVAPDPGAIPALAGRGLAVLDEMEARRQTISAPGPGEAPPAAPGVEPARAVAS